MQLGTVSVCALVAGEEEKFDGSCICSCSCTSRVVALVARPATKAWEEERERKKELEGKNEEEERKKVAKKFLFFTSSSGGRKGNPVASAKHILEELEKIIFACFADVGKCGNTHVHISSSCR